MKRINKAVSTTALVVVLLMNAKFSGYEDHWWWDLLTHFFSGLFLGFFLPRGKEKETFMIAATIWEGFEWKLATMKLWKLHDAIPEGPMAMGYENWDRHHQVNDTIVDYLIGYYGVETAKLLK